jgi:hypothetical protein
MLPTLEGVIARRVLLNFRADPQVARGLVPEPLEIIERDGYAVVGVCLIRLEHLRPKGLPAFAGLSSENLAHRIAVRYPTAQGMEEGVFVPQRYTDQGLVTVLGGRLFPGVHGRADFRVTETESGLTMDVTTEDSEANVHLVANFVTDWRGSVLFPTFAEASEFLRRGDCGFSCSLKGDKLEGVQLRALKWQMQPLEVKALRAAFFEDRKRFPPGSVEFDCALLMRGIRHEWHELHEVPELAAHLA